MRKNDINIRDPFVLVEKGVYYMYGTRARDFGTGVGGFDVYVSRDLENWSEEKECFNSAELGFNRGVNWAPEVHKYNGKYFMFATFTKENGLRGTYSLVADRPEGPFSPHSKGALTPEEWECLDGTLYINKENRPYLVFCHEHTQITDGTICFMPLNDDLSESAGDAVVLFSGSSPFFVEKKPEGEHYVTDGPFMYRSESGELFMLWSTFVKGKYAECLVKFKNGEIGKELEHMDPIISNDGGHGMIFSDGEKLRLTYHSPNQTSFERPVFREIEDCGNALRIIN